MSQSRSDASDLLWDLAAELMADDDRVVEGTIMGSSCLRVGKEFLAMPHHKKEGLVVKLPADRVSELIEAGEGESFAPAGKVFKEWLAVTEIDEGRWRELLRPWGAARARGGSRPRHVPRRTQGACRCPGSGLGPSGGPGSGRSW